MVPGSVVDPATDPVTNPMADPMADPITDPVAEPVADPAGRIPEPDPRGTSGEKSAADVVVSGRAIAVAMPVAAGASR
jgi:hypothetical protein